MWDRVIAYGILRSVDSHCAMSAFSKVRHPYHSRNESSVTFVVKGMMSGNGVYA